MILQQGISLSRVHAGAPDSLRRRIQTLICADARHDDQTLGFGVRDGFSAVKLINAPQSDCQSIQSGHRSDHQPAGVRNHPQEAAPDRSRASEIELSRNGNNSRTLYFHVFSDDTGDVPVVSRPGYNLDFKATIAARCNRHVARQ